LALNQSNQSIVLMYRCYANFNEMICDTNADAHDRGEHRMKLGVATTLMFGALAGMSAEVVTYPLEVIRRKMQLERTLASRKADSAVSPAATRLVRFSSLNALLLAFLIVSRLQQFATWSLKCIQTHHEL
jgi:hypothetical protein